MHTEERGARVRDARKKAAPMKKNMPPQHGARQGLRVRQSQQWKRAATRPRSSSEARQAARSASRGRDVTRPARDITCENKRFSTRATGGVPAMKPRGASPPAACPQCTRGKRLLAPQREDPARRRPPPPRARAAQARP